MHHIWFRRTVDWVLWLWKSMSWVDRKIFLRNYHCKVWMTSFYSEKLSIELILPWKIKYIQKALCSSVDTSLKIFIFPSSSLKQTNSHPSFSSEIPRRYTKNVPLAFRPNSLSKGERDSCNITETFCTEREVHLTPLFSEELPHCGIIRNMWVP